MKFSFEPHSAEMQFIFQILQSPSSPNSLRLPPKINWEMLYQYIIHHRVWHQAYSAIKSIHKDIPKFFYERLSQHCQKDTFFILALTAEVMHIASTFRKNSIFHCFIKGISLNLQLYPALATRPCTDIDVWVNEDSLPQVSSLLESLGYQQTRPKLSLNNFQKQYYLKYFHDIEFYHLVKKIKIELHFKLGRYWVPMFQPKPNVTKTIMLFNQPLQTLEDSYHLLLLMIHGAVHVWNRLRWLYDVVLYIKSGRCDLMQIMDLAKKLQCEHIVEQTLLLVQIHFGNEDAFLSKLIQNPSLRSIKLARIAKEFIGTGFDFNVKYTAYNPMFYKYRFYLATLVPNNKKMQVILRDLFKIEKLFSYMRFPDRYSFMYYVIYPFWLIKKLFIFR